MLLASRRAGVPAIPPMVHTAEDSRSWLGGLVERGVVWVAESGGTDAVDGEAMRVVGIMVLDDGWIDQLYVSPGWTGRGLGAALVERAKQLSPAGLTLWTFQANTGAQRFYARHGFVAVEHTDGAANEERSPDVRMVWRPR